MLGRRLRAERFCPGCGLYPDESPSTFRSAWGATELIAAPFAVIVRRRGRIVRYRWHLFERASVQAAPLHAIFTARDDPLWKLTIVNAYKPSISSYLHRRGTDAPIFAPSIEFYFHADESDAAELREQVTMWIDEARRGYRALRLAEMDAVGPDLESLLSLERCPRCGRDRVSAGDGAPGADPAATAEATPGTLDHRCAGCGLAFEPEMFIVEGRDSAPVAVVGAVALLASFAAMLLLLFGAVLAAMAAAAIGAGLVLLAALPTVLGGRSRRALLIRREGIEEVDADAVVDSARELEAPPDRPLRAPSPLFHREPVYARAWRWRDLGTMASERLDSGAWRLAAWRAGGGPVEYSTLLQGWINAPPGLPEFDILLDLTHQDGAALCEEVRRRHETCARAHPPGVPLVRTPRV